MVGGGCLASVFVMLMIIVFLVDFRGWLAAWAGYVNYNTNGNLFPTCPATPMPPLGLSSVIAMLLWCTGKLLLKKVGIQGIGISDILAYILGWNFISGEGLGFDLMEKMGLGRFNMPKEPCIAPTQVSDDDAVAANVKSVDADERFSSGPGKKAESWNIASSDDQSK
jgi:hypothetical protein